MNDTADYNDELDGNYLACKPGDVAEGLDDVCNFGMPIVGSAALLNGLYSFFLAYIKRCHRKLLARYTRDTAHDPSNDQNSPKVGTETFSYMEKLLLSNGICQVSISLSFFVYGVGTMYPTTHIKGQIGDAAGKKEREPVGLV
jgi:hypothetical protein